RRDDERWAALGALEQKRERLHRLPEAHVVGEAAADAPRSEARQPTEAFDLVRPELGRELAWHGGFERSRSVDSPDEIAPPRRLGGLRAVAHQVGDGGRAGQGDLEAAPPVENHVRRGGHALAEVALDEREAALADLDVAPAAAHRLEQRRER